MTNKAQPQWTLEEIETHIKVNVKDYGAAVVVAGLYHKLYGVMPKIGLTGFQADGAEHLSSVFPDKESK